MADTLARASAQIIPLPGACTEPVVQRRGPGRHPRNILSLRRERVSRMDRGMAQTQPPPAPSALEAAQTELRNVDNVLNTATKIFADLLNEKRALEIRVRQLQNQQKGAHHE